jgi:hypothetical protein
LSGKLGGMRPRVKAARLGRQDRSASIAQSLRRLEREHLALLMALCELERPDPACGVGVAALPAMAQMQAPLLVLLRDDLGRTQYALALAVQGRYGVCEGCTRALSRRALELKPATTRCAMCEAQVRRRPSR